MTTNPVTLRRTSLIPWISEARALLKVSAPLIAMQLMQFGMVTADIIMVGALGEKPLAAVSIGAVMYYMVWLAAYGPVMAVAPVVSHILGANPDDTRGVRIAVRMGLWAATFVSLPLMGLLVFSRPVLLALGQPEDVVGMAVPWIQVIAFGLPFTLGYGVLRNFASAAGRQGMVMAIAAGALIVNIALNYVLIYGNFGAPALGVVGSAIATAAAHAFSFACMLSLMYAQPFFRKFALLRDFLEPDWGRLRELFRLGVPMGMALIFESTLFNAATLMMGTFGAATLAAHQIAVNIAGLAFMIPVGLGLGATVRVGLAAGAGDAMAARRAGNTAIGLSALVATFFAICMALFPGSLVSLYLPAESQGAGVARLAVAYVMFAAFFHLFDALQVMGQMCLRGLKDANVPMWIAALSYWLVGFPVAWILAFSMGWQGTGVWTGLTVSLALAAVGMVWRFEWLSRTRR
jgi:MATE family multidrug resistance protein